MRTSSPPPAQPGPPLARRAVIATTLLLTLTANPATAELSIGNNPLYLVAGSANVLVVLDNSNSMDEAPSGEAVGSASAQSKSEIARGVIRNLTLDYKSRLNMGLMTYRQNTPTASYIHTSPYDLSYDPGHYDAAWTGARSSATHKRFRIPNPASPGNYIHYNVALPFYDAANQGNAFCYSPTANASNDFHNTETAANGPWDTYRCFRSKTGDSDTLPTWRSSASETLKGYTSNFFESQLSPTDSDFAQGILDFGKELAWSYVGRAWQRGDSPGRGFLYVPIKDLSATQGQTIRDKLACNVPGTPSPCTASGIPNAGNTPIEGTLLTARDYFRGSAATWSNAGEGYTASCYPLPESCGKNFVILLTDGLPSTDKNGTSVADPATALAAAAAAAATLKAAGIETYVIGMALPYGVAPGTLNQIAVAGGTDLAYNAADSASLASAFKVIFDDIFRKTSAFGSVSQNATAVNTGSRIYQARFDSTDWSGEILSLRPDVNGGLANIWSTSDSGRVPAAAVRKVFTQSGSGGVEFKLLSALSGSQQSALRTPDCSATLTGDACGQARIDWLRGSQVLEDPSGPLRKRSRLLGDFISSSPFLAKETDTLFAGANDGMLHAFDASTGNERFAFVPNAVVSRLARLTSPSYAHEYFVDGEMVVSSAEETPGQNILVASLGRGGKTLFALDVSNPGAFSAANVLWEFSDSDLGLVLGKPFIARLNSGRAAVIVGNGVNSGNEHAVLFIIDALTGALIRKIDTGAGSAAASNGLSSPRGWDADANGTPDQVYAGDLLGNLWKFDLSGSSPSAWDARVTAGGARVPLFVATDSAGNRQPITGSVGLGLNSRKNDPNYGKRYVFFGTGRYIVAADVSDRSVQSWYGLIDDGLTAIAARSALRERTIELESGSGNNTVRGFSVSSAGDMSGRRGWVLDFRSPVSGAQGERIIGESTFAGQVLLASSLLPSSNICTPGGDGFLNAIDPFSGANLSVPLFDINNDLKFTDIDRIGSDKRAIGSINPKVNLPSDAVLIGNRLIVSGTSGSVSSNSVHNPVRSGRIAWREIVR